MRHPFEHDHENESDALQRCVALAIEYESLKLGIVTPEPAPTTEFDVSGLVALDESGEWAP